MPRRKRDKRKAHKKHKQNKSEISGNSNLKQVICSFFRNIFKHDETLATEIADFILSINCSDIDEKLATEKLAEMIKSVCSDPKIDSRKIDYYIEIVIAITSTKDINGTMESILEYIAFKLFAASLKPKRSSYIDDCANWCLECTKSYPQIIHHFEAACEFFNKKHLTQLYKRQAQTQKICYVKFIAQLFKDNLISSPRIYDTLLKWNLVNNRIFHLEMLYIIGIKCGKELYCEENGNWTLLNVISDTYDMCTRCSICQHLPIKPYYTPCGHIFCGECISNAISYQEQTSLESQPICPGCAAPCGFKQLKSSLTLPHIQEILKMRKDSYWLKQLHYDVILSRSSNNKHGNPNQIEIYESKLSEIKQQREAVKQTMQKLKAEYNDLQKQIKDSKLIDSNKWNNKLQSKQTQIDKLQAKCKDFEILLQKHKSTTNAEIKQLQFEKKEIDQNFNKLQTAYQNQTLKCKDLQIKTKNLDSLITEKESDINKLSLKCKKLEKSLEKSISKQNKLKAKYNELKTNHQRVITEHKSSEYQIQQLQIAYNELEIKYNEEHKKFSYLSWNASEIANWILNMDKLRYKKYDNTLIKNMTNEGINGACLHDLDKNDLHRFGIVSFTDKCDILANIHALIRHNNMVKKKSISVEQKEAKCVICYDLKPSHICLPCGHLNVCGNCKDKLTGACPICQNNYESLVKVFHDFSF